VSAAEQSADFRARLDRVLSFPGALQEPTPATETARHLRPAPVYPAGLLPTAIARYTAASARSIGVPLEMVEVPLLFMAGGTIGNRLRITIKRGYNAFPTLYGAMVAEPGSAKTASILAAQWALHELQKEAFDVYERQRAQYEADLDEWTNKPKADRGPKPVKPQMEHLYSTDLTTEALVTVLQRSHGITIVRDELLSLVTSLDAYRGGKGSDKQLYMQLWSGTPIKSDRAGREPIVAYDPVVNVFGGIQPDILSGLNDSKGRRDGWIERLLIFWPDAEPGDWTDDDLDPTLLPPVVDIFRNLRRIGVSNPQERLSVQLSHGARDVWIEWFNANRAAVRAAQGLRRGFYAKLDMQVARLALILNTLWNADDPQRMVSEERMADAIALGEFFRDHLDRILPLLGDHSHGGISGLEARVARVLRKEATAENEGWVRRRVIIERLGNVRSEDLTTCLEEMQEFGKVEHRAVTTATKPAEEWRLKIAATLSNWSYSRDSQGVNEYAPEPGEVVFE
jgi:hypothetical protein